MNDRYKVSIPLAILITLCAIVYQRATGPTYPKKFSLNQMVNGQSQKVRVKLPRSQENSSDAQITIPTFGDGTTATVTYRRFPTNDDWTSVDLNREGSHFIGQLPAQPAAGKLQYYVTVTKNGSPIHSLGDASSPILIRFKGPVSVWILAPHIFFMFFSLLLSSIAGVEALFGTTASRKVATATLLCIVIGGLILGPLVQKSAFGVYWAGFPYDWDLTDNKLLVGFLGWLIAVTVNLKTFRPRFIVAAAIILVGMYCIPHSMMGSQYNYEEGVVETDR